MESDEVWLNQVVYGEGEEDVEVTKFLHDELFST